MKTKTEKKEAGKNGDKDLIMARQAIIKSAIDFQDKVCGWFMESNRGRRMRCHSLYEVKKLFPYCLTQIRYGKGFEKENPIEGIRAFNLAMVLEYAELQPIKYIEKSNGLDIQEGCVSIKWEYRKKAIELDMYCKRLNAMEFIGY